MAAYRSLAFHYDHFMHHVDYDAWVDYCLTALNLPLTWRHGRPPRILDLACGTGSVAVRLAQRGYDVIGIDRSAEMLSVAEAKMRDADVSVLLSRQDMTEFALDEPVDACVCLCDSLNYLTEDGALGRAFAHTAAALRPRAPFFFDVHTEARFRKYAESVFAADEGSIAYIWESEYDDASRLCTMYLTVFAAEGQRADVEYYARIDETHIERAFEFREIREALGAAGLVTEAIYGELRFDPPIEGEGRQFYLTRKK